MSRRFVVKTAAQLATWQTASLETLDLIGLILDGVHIGEHCLSIRPGKKSVKFPAGVPSPDGLRVSD